MNEPPNVALAIAEMQLDYVVVTSVNRDDLPDQGAGHFAACIREIRAVNPNTLLIPDFSGWLDLLDVVLNAAPDVLGHNVEPTRRPKPAAPTDRIRVHRPSSSSPPTLAAVVIACVAASVRVFDGHPLVGADLDGQPALVDGPVVGIAGHHQLLEGVCV